MNTLLQEIAVELTFGALVLALGFGPLGWQFWALITVFYLSIYLNRLMGKTVGIIEYLKMSPQEQQRIRTAFDEVFSENKK